MTGIPDELDRRFRDAAAAEGLLDVAYDVTESPIGPLLVAASERGLCRISFDPEPEHELDALARAFGPRVLRSAAPVDRVRREARATIAADTHGSIALPGVSAMPIMA